MRPVGLGRGHQSAFHQVVPDLFARLAGTQVPVDREIFGINLRPETVGPSEIRNTRFRADARSGKNDGFFDAAIIAATRLIFSSMNFCCHLCYKFC